MLKEKKNSRKKLEKILYGMLKEVFGTTSLQSFIDSFCRLFDIEHY